MKTKEELIKEAWGIHYSSNVNKNGFKVFKKSDKVILESYICDYWDIDNEHSTVRPKSLQGIENNNGWIKIKSKDDLPKEDNKIGYLVIDTDEKIHFTNLRHFINRLQEGHPYTHYQPIFKPNKPLY